MPSFILLELTDGTYKVKETDFVVEIQIISQIDDVTYSETEKFVISETQVKLILVYLVKLKLKIYKISKKQSSVK